MRLVTAVKKIAVPFLQEFGFELSFCDTGASVFDFENSDETRKIRLDIDIFIQGYLRASYHYINSYFGNYSGVQLDSLNPEMRMGIEVFPTAPDQVENSVRNIMQITKEKVFSYVDFLAANEVFVTYDMYQMLSKNTQEKAAAFAQRNGLDFSRSKYNAQIVEKVLLKLRGEDRYQRKSRFAACRNEIVEVIAYWGEVIRREEEERSHGKWQWESDEGYLELQKLQFNEGTFSPLSKLQLNKEAFRPKFLIQYEEGDFSPAGTIAAFWNRYSEQSPGFDQPSIW